tara:strand:+ start:149 stop:307 length:159 start_codon:yes stop_codon:yes gene_type:complete
MLCFASMDDRTMDEDRCGDHWKTLKNRMATAMTGEMFQIMQSCVRIQSLAPS